MKKNILTAALGAALIAGFSSTASAWTPSDTPDLQINMSGATAMDNSITSLFTSLCDAGTLHSYFNDGPNPGNRYRAFFCTLSPDKIDGISASQKVLFVKRSAGGSAQGVNPLIDQQRLEAMNIFNNNCTLSPTATDPNRYLCSISNPGDLELRYSDIGISDVDVKMFRGVNTPAGFNPVNPESAEDLDSVSVAALMFGIPVNNALYDALQTVQRGEGLLPNDCTIGEYADEKCIPSLTKQQVASLMSGTVKTWDDFKIDGIPLTQYPGVAPLPATRGSKFVRYCKRVNGSGTGAQQYAKFLHNPCVSGAAEPMQSSNISSGPIVIQNSGSGDIELCLNDYELGINNTGANTGFFTPTTKAWAFGVQSMEKNADQVWPYKFVRIDGVTPILANAFNGKYFDVVEMTYQWLKPGVNKLPSCDGEHLATCGPKPPEGDVKVIIEQMRTEASEPSVVASILNVKSNYPFGKSGYLAPAIPFATDASFTGILNENAPIWPYTHDLGAGINNCVVPTIPSAVVNKPLL